MRPGTKRPDINLVELEKLCRLNVTNDEIAAFFGVCTKTVQREYARGEDFKRAVDKGRAHGRLSLRRSQMKLADAGNATMLVWLGKQLLRQSDAPVEEADDVTPTKVVFTTKSARTRPSDE